MTPTDATTALPRSVAELPPRQRSRAEARTWRGPRRHYDIVKEATIALVVVLVLAVGLAALFSSPDKPAVTLRQWSDAQPTGFVLTAASELQGTSTTATYGPPYNHGTGSLQYLGPISIQKLFGVTQPINPARSFVLDPLSLLPPTPTLSAAVHRFEAATAAQQHAWAAAYVKRLGQRSLSAGLPSTTTTAAVGPVPTLMSSLLGMAQTGALDSALVSQGSFYNDNYTKPLMFLGDSATAQDNSYWNQIVTAEHLQGSQWGVMNETGSWPGQPWLWLYSMWYQVPPMSTSGNADILVVAIVAVLSLALLLVPFIPGLRSLPRWIPLHRAIWRRYYAEAPVAADPGPGTATPPAPGHGLPAEALGTDGA